MKRELLKKEVLLTVNIFDFVSIIYYRLNEISSLNKLYGRYNKVQKLKSMNKIFVKLKNNFKTLFFDCYDIDSDDFRNFRQHWIKLFEETKLNCDLFCYETLNIFDQYYNDESIGLKSIISFQGPLNISFRNIVLFYNKPPENYNLGLLKENKIRIGRQTVIDNPSDLSNIYHNFEVKSVNRLGDYIPKINRYNKSLVLNKEVKVGIVPVDVLSYTRIKKIKESKLIEFTYNNELKSKIINKLHCTLINMEQQNVNIAIFPELFLFPEIINELICFLRKENFENLKLIMTGSQWNNNKNTAYILSSQGTILLEHTKKIAYDYYFEGERYVENIDTDKSLEFLDIEGLGRIGYQICKDALSDQMVNLYTSIMCVNIIFISACTGCTKTILDYAATNALTKIITTIMCNACSLINSENYDENKLLGFVCYPDSIEKKSILVKEMPIFDCMDCNNFEDFENGFMCIDLPLEK